MIAGDLTFALRSMALYSDFFVSSDLQHEKREKQILWCHLIEIPILLEVTLDDE